jgi:thymidylate synthase (FAD)
MKLINSSVKIVDQKPGLQGIYEQIELGARVCYKSEGCIKYDEEGNSLTAKDFVDKITKVYKHESVASHGTVYLKVPMNIVINSLAESEWDLLSHNHWTKYTCDSEFYYYTTNYRVLLENKLLDVLKYLCEPTKWHERRVSVKVICPISVSREWNRHTSIAPSEQSTRYCNYSKDKFDNQLTFCIPYWLKDELQPVSDYKYLVSDSDNIPDNFLWMCYNAEVAYNSLLEDGFKPQEAREVLPLCTATEVMYTAFVSDWKKFFKLRTADNAHPDIRKLATTLQLMFQARKLI